MYGRVSKYINFTDRKRKIEKMSDGIGKGTRAVHAGVKHDASTGAIMTPVYLTSTYVQTRVGEHKGYEYSRTQNPTRHALENAFAELEGANHGLAFASGLAAIDNLLKLLKPGDEVISTNDLYGGSYRLFTHTRISFPFTKLTTACTSVIFIIGFVGVSIQIIRVFSFTTSDNEDSQLSRSTK